MTTFSASATPSRSTTRLGRKHSSLKLYERCQRLGAMPRAFPLLPNREESGVRRRVHGSYLIFYKINAETVEVVHILHGARDYAAVLFPEE